MAKDLRPTWFPIFGFGEGNCRSASHTVLPPRLGNCSADNKSPSGDSSSSGHLAISFSQEGIK